MKIENGRMFSYADDTAIVFSGGTWTEVRGTAETSFKSRLSRIAEWLNQSLHTLNASKSNYICFTKYYHTQPLNDFQIKIHNCSNPSYPLCVKIDRLQHTKYLGVMIDQRLSWHMHTEPNMKSQKNDLCLQSRHR